MKLEVGMYVRTKWGRIGKIIDISKSFDVTNIDNPISLNRYEVDTNYNFEDEPDGYFKEDIIKASHNIGEILEAGDFLDSHYIERIEGTTIFLTDGWFIDFDDVEELVTSIVTKEQFERMSYEVGG